MKNVVVLVVAILLVLCLVVGVWAAEVGSFIQTKDNWGEKYLTVINLNILGSPPVGIRIDGGLLFLI